MATRRPRGTGSVTRHGYVQMRIGNGRRKFLHVLIAESALGRALEGYEDVHHVDGNRANNLPSNLVLCPSRKYHKLLHIRAAALEATGDPEMRKCCLCKQYDHKRNMYDGAAKSRGCDETYTHRTCSNKAAAESHRRNYVPKALRRVASSPSM